MSGSSAVTAALLKLTEPFKMYSVDAYAVIQNFDAPGVDSNYITFTLVIQGVSKTNCQVTWNSQVIVSFSAPNQASSFLSLWDVNTLSTRLAAQCPY